MKTQKIILLIILMATIGITVIACSANNAVEPVYHKISPDEAKQMMDSGESYTLLDVRTSSEFAESHIDGAVLIPNSELTARAESELPDKHVMILVYCRSGVRSASAAHELVGMGYTSVYDFGGIIDWPYERVGS